MQQTSLAGKVLVPIKLVMGALLMLTVVHAQAACSDSGATCPKDDAPATQQGGNAPDTGVGNPINVISCCVPRYRRTLSRILIEQIRKDSARFPTFLS